MFSPRPFGMSSTKAKSLMKTKRRRVQILDGETSYAKWERIFMSRKHTLMQKACDLEISTGSQVTIVIQTLFGDAWCYASSDDIYQKLLNSEVILRNCIRADNELLYKNYHRQAGSSQQQPWAGFTGANQKEQQRGTLSFQETPCSEQSDPDLNATVHQRCLPTIGGNNDLNKSGSVKVGHVTETNNVTVARSNQLSQSQSALSNSQVLEHKVTGKSKNQSPRNADAMENMTNQTKQTSSNETQNLYSKSKSMTPIQRNSTVNKSDSVRAGHVNRNNNNVTAVRSKQLPSSQSAMCNPAVSQDKDTSRPKNQSSKDSTVENTTNESKKTSSNESQKLLCKSKSTPVLLLKTRDQCTQSSLRPPTKQALQTGSNARITSMPGKTDHENINLTRKREQPHHLLFDDSEEETEVESKHFSSVKHNTTQIRNVSSSSSGSSSTSSSSSSSDSSDSDEETRAQSTSVKDNSRDTLSTVNVSGHAKGLQSKVAVLKTSPQLKIPKSEPNCYETFLSNLNHDAKRQSQSEPNNDQSRSIADVPPKPSTSSQAVRSGTSFHEHSSSIHVNEAGIIPRKYWAVVANNGAVVRMEKITTPIKPSNLGRPGSCPPQKHRSKCIKKTNDNNMNAAVKNHHQQVRKFLPTAGCKAVGGEPTRSVSTKPQHSMISTPSPKKRKKNASRNKQSKNNHTGMQPFTVNDKKRSIGKPCNNQNKKKNIIGREGKTFKNGTADRHLHEKQTARDSQLSQQRTTRPENKSTDERRQAHVMHKSATHCQHPGEIRYHKNNNNRSDDNKPKLDARKSFDKSSFSRKSAHNKMDDKSQFSPVTLQNRKRKSSQSSNINMSDSKRGCRGNVRVSEPFHDPRDFSDRYSRRKQTDDAYISHHNLFEPEHLRPRHKSPAPVTLTPRFSESHTTRNATPFYPSSRTNAMSRPDHLISVNQYPSDYPNCNIRQNVNNQTNHRSEVRPLLELQCHPPRHHFIDRGRYFNMTRNFQTVKMPPK